MNYRLILPLLALVLAALACASPFSGSGSGSGRFEGHYTAGFEVSSFVPCGAAEEAGYGAGYWLTGPSEFFERYDRLVTESGHDPVSGYFPVYVVFEGELSPEGNYGHLGAYSHEITVTNLIEMSLEGC